MSDNWYNGDFSGHKDALLYVPPTVSKYWKAVIKVSKLVTGGRKEMTRTYTKTASRERFVTCEEKLNSSIIVV